MKIVESNFKTQPFLAVTPGIVFKDHYCIAYMRIPPVKLPGVIEGTSIIYNAVSLKDGEIHHFDDEEEVSIFPDASLILQP